MNNNYPALTGIRAIAAYMVFLHHNDIFKESIFGKLIHNFFTEFHVGVTIFFVLSGFLICNRYFNQVNFNFRDYIVKRFARIYPMYFIITTLTFVYFGLMNAHFDFRDLKIYLLNITFLKGFFEVFKFSGIGQGWSLTVEESFYLLAPLFFLSIKRSKFYLFIIPLVFVLIGCFFVSVFEDISFSSFFKTNDFMLDFTIFGRITEFIIGISLAIYLDKFRPIFKYFTFVGLFFILVSIFLLSVLKPTENGFGTDCITGKIINTLVLPLFGIAPLFYGLIYEKNFISKILSSKVFQLLGRSSYIFYLIHLGIFYNLLKEFNWNILNIFLTLNLMSILLYYSLEKPLNHYIRNRYLQNNL